MLIACLSSYSPTCVPPGVLHCRPATPLPHSYTSFFCRSANQRYFSTTAAVFLGTVGAMLAFFLAGMAATLAQPDCGYPWVTIAVMEFFRVRVGQLSSGDQGNEWEGLCVQACN